MTGALTALLRKEWQQQRAAFAWLGVFTLGMTWVLRLMTDVSGGVLSYLVITSFYCMPVLVLIALLLGQRMIAAEYYGRTQRFLEALPMPRGLLQWVKFALGYAALLLLTAGVWLYSISVANDYEFIRWQFVGLMALRLLAYVFVVWCVVFTLSLLGRLRLPLIAAAAFAVLVLDNYTAFELNRAGPLALIDQQLFALERDVVPARDLIVTVVIGLGFLAVGLWLSLKHDGSLIESLATPLTGRAKGFLVALVIATVGLFAYFGPEPEPAPYAISDPLVLSENRVRVSYVDPAYLDDATALLAYLAERVAALEAHIPIEPPEFLVRVSLAPALAPWEYETYLVSRDEGTALLANYRRGSPWDQPLFGAFAFHQILTAASQGRYLLEPHHWMVDGFTRWWAAHGEQAAAPLNDAVDGIALEALYITADKPADANTLRNWDASADAYGESSVMTLGYVAWRVLQEEVGTDTAMALAAATYSLPTHRDARDWWQDRRESAAARFERITGLGWAQFNQLWLRRFEELRGLPAYRDALAALPRADWSIEPTVGWFGSRSLNYRLTLDRPIAAGNDCAALHTGLGVYDVPLSRAQLLQEPLTAGDPDEPLTLGFELEGHYGRDTRVFAAIECKLAAFPQPVILGATRLTMP